VSGGRDAIAATAERRHTHRVDVRTVGVEEEFLLVDPVSGYVRPAAPAVLRHGHRSDPTKPEEGGTRKLLDALVGHVADALEAYGDLDFVRDQLVRLQDRGTGAALQRRALERDGSLSAGVADAVAATVS
jgi:hypothetical protein